MRSKKHLGKFIREARLKNNVTQKTLASKLGCTSQFVANWERGVSRPPIKYMEKIKTTLNIPDKKLIDFLVQESLTDYRNLFKNRL